VILAHTLGAGGPEIEFLIVAAGMLVLAVIFFFQKTVKPQVPVFLALGAFALTAGAFAVGGGDSGGGDAMASDVEISISSPADGADVPANQPLTVEVEISNGSLTQATSSDDPSEGHLHIYVDGRVIAMPTAETAEIPAADLPPGEHEIMVEFTQANHESFAPPVVTSIDIVAQ
jgi:hypothetical protein